MERADKQGKIPISGMIARWALFLLLFAILVFAPAGTLDWPEGWLLLGLYIACSIVVGAWMLENDPAWLVERLSLEKGEFWDMVLLLLIGACFIAVFVISGLYHAQLPSGAEALGFFGMVLAFAFVFSVLKVNPYITRMVKVSKGQKVISTGPYSVVRHPMYAGAIVFYLSIPIALGSLYALAPALCGAALFVLRTYMEDKTLRKRLKGYEEYCNRTRYRLIPYVW